MKKIVFFPYHPDLKILIDHKGALRDFQIAGFISYKEDNSLVHSLNQILGLEDLPYDQLLHDCDAVILLDNYRDYEADKYYQVIEDAANRQKEIYITPLAQVELDLNNHQGQYKLLEFIPAGMQTIGEEFERKRRTLLYEIDVPVIGVIGQGKHCDKFENQLLLKEVLEDEYETITVTTNALGALFGCYTIPSFLYEDQSFEEKILRFNYYIRKLIKIGNPDVLILGIPEGITPFEKKEFHHFAEYPLVITAAVPIDMAILCTYFIQGMTQENGLERMAEFCQNKFSVPVGAISMSRTAFEIPNEEIEKIIFEYLDKPYLLKNYPDLKGINLPMINILDREEASVTIKLSLRRLQENIRVI